MPTVARSTKAKTRDGARLPMSRMAKTCKAVEPGKEEADPSRSPCVGAPDARASRACDGSGVGLGGSAEQLSHVMRVLSGPGAAEARALEPMMHPARTLLHDVHRLVWRRVSADPSSVASRIHASPMSSTKRTDLLLQRPPPLPLQSRGHAHRHGCQPCGSAQHTVKIVRVTGGA